MTIAAPAPGPARALASAPASAPAAPTPGDAPAPAVHGARRAAWDRIRQLVRYGTVSIISTSVSLTVLGVLVATASMAAGWANVVATAVGTVPSFELNRRWVWSRTGDRSVGREIVPFVALSFAGLALSTLLVSVAGRWATRAGVGAAARTGAVEVASIVAFGSMWLVQFVILDRLVFTTRAPAPGVLESV